MTAEETPHPTSRWLPTGAAFLAVVALLVLALDGLRQVGSLFAPVFLGLTLVLTVDPVRRWAVRRGAPLWVATVGVLVLLYGVLLLIVFGIGVALTQLIQVLPDYQDEFQDLYDRALQAPEAFGVQIDSLQDVIGTLDPGSVLPVVNWLVSGLSSVSTMLVFLALSIAFLTLDLTHGPRRLDFIRRHRPHLAAALHDFAQRIGRYWAVSSIFGLIQGVLNGILLTVLDVPLPLVWGLLAFLTSYIPNIGFVIGLVPPVVLALLDGGLGTMVAVLAGYVVINFIVKTLIMPKFAGEAVGLNVTTTFVSLVFWAVMIGPLGALLAVPLTLFGKAILIDSHPDSRWLGTFLTSDRFIEEPAAPS